MTPSNGKPIRPSRKKDQGSEADQAGKPQDGAGAVVKMLSAVKARGVPDKQPADINPAGKRRQSERKRLDENCRKGEPNVIGG